MIGLLQRVNEASVHIDGEPVAEIDRGLAVLVGIQKNDDTGKADRLLERLLGYRVFNDEAGRMNLSLRDIQGGLLLVPQFTLAADTKKGMRPGFSSAADPEVGKHLFSYLTERAQALYQPVACGIFGADMQVALINNGPVTFWLEC
ncbi:MAG: D-tyrosyl-tRNA(Tyr) deacylase [Candidatus Thiodiazotropha sp. (ex Lucina aurantia)]|nr:D-tyrosyl-tRNA(Tyr) deacylase [Candidatus Thiodiazotropha taylori]MBT3038874.1 D-tyrosyl-tRNA(Tyr) deacylase [Candidatus Thiodiazotropha sp. (ex Codakia orbicularis)]MBV2105282.1 D-tyrosyl-tRNA(Tyr) deacylase [Candidatus Thiodiazotropha sp. (ex Lucina aurantia)]MCG7863556.1 D-aminoacyl-tRNA deacylase [Candidatus Thiodiazotropha endolucinida]MBV2101150.1 D-tyrosyl-tRNA(Tyr) deacylase [Candidatus Thiodiazotropha sp. (ex Codakia orbicularis)]